MSCQPRISGPLVMLRPAPIYMKLKLQLLGSISSWLLQTIYSYTISQNVTHFIARGPKCAAVWLRKYDKIRYDRKTGPQFTKHRPEHYETNFANVKLIILRYI